MTYIADLNIMGLKNCEAICGILEQYYTKVDFTIIGKESDLDELVQKKPDLVLSGVKYIGFEAEAIAKDSSNKIWLSDHLGTAGINYTGSSKSAIALEFDKAEAKKKMQDAGVATAPFFTVEPDQYPDEQAFPLSLPLFVKPLYQGGGSGIGPDSVVTSFEEFQTKVQAIHDVYRQPALAEGYLRGREFTVAILDIGADDDITF